LKKNKIFSTVIRLLTLAVCGGVLGYNLYLANANKLVGNQMPMPFGYGSAVVLSGSMEPTLSVGDLIIVSEARPYGENDIVVFQSGNSLVVHRIIEIEGESVITQGDANNTPDSPINKSVIKGKVVAVVPQVGTAVNFIKSPIGTIMVVVLAVVLMELPYRKEKEKDDQQRQKIIDEINRLKNQ